MASEHPVLPSQGTGGLRAVGMRDGRKERWEQEREQELQMADGSDSPSYKQGFWMAGLYFGAELVQFVTTRKWERNESWL